MLLFFQRALLLHWLCLCCHLFLGPEQIFSQRQELHVCHLCMCWPYLTCEDCWQGVCTGQRTLSLSTTCLINTTGRHPNSTLHMTTKLHVTLCQAPDHTAEHQFFIKHDCREVNTRMSFQDFMEMEHFRLNWRTQRNRTAKTRKAWRWTRCSLVQILWNGT